MGVLWRMLAPKPVKKLRRAAHPVRVVSRAVTPPPVLHARRAVWSVRHPVRRGEQAAADALVYAMRGATRRKRR